MTGKTLRGTTPVTYEDHKERMREYQRKKRAGLLTKANPDNTYSREEVRKLLSVTTYGMRKVIDCGRARMPDPLDILYSKTTYYNKEQIDNWLPYITELMMRDNLEPDAPAELDTSTEFFKWLRQYKPRPNTYWYAKFIERYDNGYN